MESSSSQQADLASAPGPPCSRHGTTTAWHDSLSRRIVSRCGNQRTCGGVTFQDGKAILLCEEEEALRLLTRHSKEAQR